MRKVNVLPQVVIVGRSNVGKSTLFNKIAEGKLALVDTKAGTTRDILETSISWRAKKLLIASSLCTASSAKTARPRACAKCCASPIPATSISL